MFILNSKSIGTHLMNFSTKLIPILFVLFCCMAIYGSNLKSEGLAIDILSVGEQN